MLVDEMAATSKAGEASAANPPEADRSLLNASKTISPRSVSIWISSAFANCFSFADLPDWPKPFRDKETV
jgi:hypothetical protein